MFKPLRCSDYTVAISVKDPAIDADATGSETLAEFEQLRLKAPSAFRDKIKVKSGETLTEFLVGVIPADEMTRIQDECRPGRPDAKYEEMFWRSFIHGLRDIKGWPDTVEKKNVGGVEYVRPEWIKKTFIRGLRSVALDIGSQVWSWNNLTEEEIKNS